jgi:uncharacterized membrane protein
MTMRNRNLLIIASLATVFTLGSLAYAGAASNTTAPANATVAAQQTGEPEEREYHDQAEQEHDKGKTA